MADSETGTVDEYERQFKYIQALKKLDFFANKNFEGFEEANENDSKDERESTFSTIKIGSQSSFDDDYQGENADESEAGGEPKRAIDIINKKISKLDSIFANLEAVKMVGRPSSYEVQPDMKTREAIALAKEREEKKRNLFSGVYSMKSVIYNLKTSIPPPIQFKSNDSTDPAKIPKLVEVYQYPGYDKNNKNFLPYDVDLYEVLDRVIESILILQKQPTYKNFLEDIYFSTSCVHLIYDTFWWCYLQRYQKLPKIQENYFYHISENYVKLLFTEMEPRYRDTFFKGFADLLAMSVYTIFVTCFPESCMTQFNENFKEFLCEICHLWISGCKPTPRSYLNWNFAKIDPPGAVFAKEVLNNKQNNIIEELNNIGTAYQTNFKASSRSSQISSVKGKSSVASSLGRRRLALIPSDLSMITSESTKKSAKAEQFFRSVKKKSSHPIGRGPEFDNALFDIFGHSPLVEYFLYNKKARKINRTATLVSRSNIIELPALNAKTYNDIIKESVRNIKKIEKGLKETQERHKDENTKLENKRAHFMRDYNKSRDLLLSNSKEVNIMGDLIAMNMSRDANTTHYGLESALNKAFQNSRLSSRN